MLLIIGFILALIVFSFTHIASKRKGIYFLAPIITFLFALGLTAYGLFFVGGFEGMAFGAIAIEFIIVSAIGTLLLPYLTRNQSEKTWSRMDKVSLSLLPLIFFLMIGLIIYSDKGYWVADQGQQDGGGVVEGYVTSTIMEGRKEVHLQLGDDYVGKAIKVKKVKKRGPTEVTVEIIEGENKDKVPYIRIGLDKINEPLVVKTTKGVVFSPTQERE